MLGGGGGGGVFLKSFITLPAVMNLNYKIINTRFRSFWSQIVKQWLLYITVIRFRLSRKIQMCKKLQKNIFFLNQQSHNASQKYEHCPICLIKKFHTKKKYYSFSISLSLSLSLLSPFQTKSPPPPPPSLNPCNKIRTERKRKR